MLELSHVSVRAGGRPLLDDISCVIPDRGMTLLLGRNGSGKTTLLRCINGTAAYSGQILYNGRDMKKMRASERARIYALLPQNLPQTGYTVRELLETALLSCGRLIPKLTPDERDRIGRTLEEFGLAGLADRNCASLSGGERQRAFTAMAFVRDTELLITDEPATFLDSAGTDEVFARLAGKKQERAVLAVSHCLNGSLAAADRVIVLGSGHIVFSGTREECLKTDIIERTFRIHRYTDRLPEGQVLFF